MAKSEESPQHAGIPSLPRETVHRLTAPLTRFLHIESASGIVLLAVTVVALGLANSGLSDSFLALWKIPIGFEIGEWSVRH